MALVGINHVALEVGSIDEALAFWERLFGPLRLRSRSGSMAFVDLGDQFVALMRAPHGEPDTVRHRLKVYAERTADLIDHYDTDSIVKRVNGEASVDEVTNRIRKALGLGAA